MRSFHLAFVLCVACGAPDAPTPEPGEDTGVPTVDTEPPDTDLPTTDTDVSTTDTDASTFPGRTVGAFDADLVAEAKLIGAGAGGGTGDGGDSVGADLASPGDLDGDAVPDLAVLASGGENPFGLWLGVISVLSGVPSPGVAPLAGAAAATLVGNRGGLVHVVASHDVDGDGTGDLVGWGANVYADGILVWSGARVIGAPAPVPPVVQLVGTDTYVSGVGSVDLDGDGVYALLSAAPSVPAGTFRGRVALIPEGTLGPYDVTSAPITLSGVRDDEFLNQTIAAGDVDGDGVPDVLVGGAADLDGPGELAVFDGTTLVAPVTAADALVVFSGANPFDMLEHGQVPGDLDGDGYAELGVWGDALDLPGLYVFAGPVTGADALATADALVDGGSQTALYGLSYDPVGDFDGDGLDDLLVRYTAGPGGFGVAVVYGPVAGSVTLDEAFDVLYDGPLWGTGAGDVDGDGRPDLWLGNRFDSDGGTNAGAAWLVLAP